MAEPKKDDDSVILELIRLVDCHKRVLFMSRDIFSGAWGIAFIYLIGLVLFVFGSFAVVGVRCGRVGGDLSLETEYSAIGNTGQLEIWVIFGGFDSEGKMRRMTSALSELCKIDVEFTRSNGKVELVTMEEVKTQ